MYELEDHLDMVRDEIRVGSYARAIAAVVQPGDRVLELGAGVGILTLLALQAGAAHVWAVERSEVLMLLQEALRERGWVDRVTCIQAEGRDLDLHSPVDVLVSDLRGALPVLEDNLEVIARARRRFLEQGGRMIPLREKVFLAPVEHAAGHARISGWRRSVAGFDFSAAADVAANRWYSMRLGASALLSAGREVLTVDYSTLEELDLVLRGSFQIERPGTLHGLGGWFESEMAPGVRLSTSPEGPPTVHGQAFFPLFEAYDLSPGDTVSAVVEARASGPGGHVWLWRVEVLRAGRAPVVERHSSFEGALLSTENLAKAADAHVPSLTAAGVIDRAILERMDGTRSLREIAEELSAGRPSEFEGWLDALRRVAALSVKYSR